MEERIKECSKVTIECDMRVISPNDAEPATHRTECSFVMGVDVQYPSVEKALMDKQAGDRVQVRIPPEEIFGAYDEKLVCELPKCDYREERLAVGKMYRQIRKKCLVQFMVKEIRDDVIVADLNDPRSGTRAEFDILVKDVRPATKEEMKPSCAKVPEFPGT